MKKRYVLVTEVTGNQGLQEAIADNHVLKDAVKTALNKADDGFHSIVKRAIIENLISANNIKQKFIRP